MSAFFTRRYIVNSSTKCLYYLTFVVVFLSAPDICFRSMIWLPTHSTLLTHSVRFLNPLMPNDPYTGRTAPLTSKRYILYIYSTNIGAENFKHGIYSPFFSLQNSVCFIILTYLVPVLFTFYIQVC